MNSSNSSWSRIVQLKDQKMKRHDLSLSLESINQGFLKENKHVREWLKEFVRETLEKISLDGLDKIKLKLVQVHGIHVSSDVTLVTSLVDTIVRNILIPDYFFEGNTKDLFKKEIENCIGRMLNKVDTILLREQKSPFVLYIGDEKHIQQEIDYDGDLDGSRIWIGSWFGYNIYWYNEKNKRFAFEIPIRIAIPSKLSGEIKENDPKKIQKHIEWLFGKKWNISVDKKWKWFSVSTRIHTDSEKIYWKIEKARYLILNITHENVEDLSEEMMSHEDILTNLKKFITINNYLIAESGNIIGWNGKTKRASIIWDSTPSISSWDEGENEIDDEIRTKFGKLMVHMKESVKLDDIWWQEKAKEEINKIVALIQNKDIAEQWWAHMTTGIIFYGPSGTGKTLFARCLATAVDADVYAIKMTDLANTAYINEGAKNVQDLFKYLRNQASKNPDKKLIVIFDELDALFKNRENRNSSGEDTKVVNTFLTEMDGFDTLKNVIIVGTTNRLESLDNAVKRPWRLGTHIKIDLPSRDERAEIFQIHISSAQKKAKRPHIFQIWEWDYIHLAEISEWFSGAEITEIIRIVLEQKFYEQVQWSVWNVEPVSIDDLTRWIEKLRTQNGNKNNILRDLSIPGLAELITHDKSGSIWDALRSAVINKLTEQIYEKIASGAVTLPDVMVALSGESRSIGFTTVLSDKS